MVVLPAPVAPTKAIFCPGLAQRLMSCRTSLVLVVAEVHVVKHHAALQPGVGDGAVGLVGMLPGPDVGALVAASADLPSGVLLGVDQLDIAVVGLGLLVHQVEDTLRAGGGGDHEVHLLADLGDGLGEALVQADKGDDGADGHAGQPVDAQHRAHDGHQSA